jgi:hypothetical protein
MCSNKAIKNQGKHEGFVDRSAKRAVLVTSKNDLVTVADQLGDTAQSMVALIAAFECSGSEANGRRAFLIASRLRLLAESLAPQHDSLSPNSQAPCPIELGEDLLALVRKAEDVVHRAARAEDLQENLRISIICQVSRLRLLITFLASRVLPGGRMDQLLDFPVEV